MNELEEMLFEATERVYRSEWSKWVAFSQFIYLAGNEVPAGASGTVKMMWACEQMDKLEALLVKRAQEE